MCVHTCQNGDRDLPLASGAIWAYPLESERVLRWRLRSNRRRCPKLWRRILRCLKERANLDHRATITDPANIAGDTAMARQRNREGGNLSGGMTEQGDMAQQREIFIQAGLFCRFTSVLGDFHFDPFVLTGYQGIPPLRSVA